LKRRFYAEDLAYIRRALRAAGFLVTFHDGYGGIHLPPGHAVAEALKIFH
jgi:hypothetical protein